MIGEWNHASPSRRCPSNRPTGPSRSAGKPSPTSTAWRAWASISSPIACESPTRIRSTSRRHSPHWTSRVGSSASPRHPSSSSTRSSRRRPSGCATASRARTRPITRRSSGSSRTGRGATSFGRSFATRLPTSRSHGRIRPRSRRSRRTIGGLRARIREVAVKNALSCDSSFRNSAWPTLAGIDPNPKYASAAEGKDTCRRNVCVA